MHYLSLDYWRAHLLELLYGVAGFVLFLVFLFATFPYAPAIKGLLSPLGLRFDSAEQQLALPFGARLDNVSIRSLTAGAPPIFQSHSVHIWPALGSLLLLHPGISGDADSYGGSLWFNVHRLGAGAKVSFDATKLDLASLHVLKQIGAALGGELFGDGKVAINPVSPTDNSGEAHLIAKGFLIRIPGPMAAIRLGEVDLKVRLDQGILHVEELKSSEGDLAIDGHGSIRLDNEDWHQSALALELMLTPAPTARQRLAFLINFLPHPPNGVPYKLDGTIASPLLS
jgi:type II secretion system protein N